MEVEINWLAILLATIVSMVVAGVWYTKATFGPVWRKLTGISEKDSAKAGKTPMIIVLFANVVTGLVLATMIPIASAFFANSSLWIALAVGFVTWLAFSATTLTTHNAFELKPNKLTLINNGYQLVLFLSIALTLHLVGN